MSTSQPYDDCIEHYYQRLANIQVIGSSSNIIFILQINGFSRIKELKQIFKCFWMYF